MTMTGIGRSMVVHENAKTGVVTIVDKPGVLTVHPDSPLGMQLAALQRPLREDDIIVFANEHQGEFRR